MSSTFYIIKNVGKTIQSQTILSDIMRHFDSLLRWFFCFFIHTKQRFIR